VRVDVVFVEAALPVVITMSGFSSRITSANMSLLSSVRYVSPSLKGMIRTSQPQTFAEAAVSSRFCFSYSSGLSVGCPFSPGVTFTIVAL